MLNKKAILLIGAISFFLLLVLSIVFYKERTCFVDIAFHLFYILKDNDFAIQNYRFGAFFTQLFPLSSAYLGLNLKSITIAYSMSFVLLPFIVFLLILLILKNQKIAIAYLFFAVLMTTHTFYWIQSELPQAMAFFFIYLALFDNYLEGKKNNLYLYYSISLILISIFAFTHPLMLIPFSFTLFYFWIIYKNKRKEIYIQVFLFSIIYLIKAIFFKTKYDSQAMDGLHNFKKLFPDYFTLKSNLYFFHYLIKDYYFLLLFFIVTVIYFLRNRNFLKLTLVIAYFIATTLLINITYPNGANQFYIENQYQLLAYIVILPFTYEIYNFAKNKSIQFGIISLISLVCSFRIINTSDIYIARLNWNRNIISNTNNLSNKKLIIPNTQVPSDTLMMTWSTSYEIWLLSTIETDTSRSIIIEEQENEFDYALSSNKSFLTKWGSFDYTDLNPKYFHFFDTTNYVKLK